MTLYRKYRPQTFDQVLGQDHIVASIYAQLRQDKATHAYLFVGPRGTGKTTVARLMALYLNCVSGGEKPCGRCDNCLAIIADSFADVIELDAATNRGIDTVRGLRDRAQFAPMIGVCKVYIVDEAHMLTGAAANALLKTLEEPPDPVKFVLVTTQEESILPTIRSRCQVHRFGLISNKILREFVAQISAEEGKSVPTDVLGLVVDEAGGSARDALSVLDSVFYTSDRSSENVRRMLGRATYSDVAAFIDCLADRNAMQALTMLNELMVSGVGMQTFRREVISWLRGLLHVYFDSTCFSHPHEDQMQEQTWAFGAGDILICLKAFSEWKEYFSFPQLPLEMAVVSCCLEMEETGDF